MPDARPTAIQETLCKKCYTSNWTEVIKNRRAFGKNTITEWICSYMLEGEMCGQKLSWSYEL